MPKGDEKSTDAIIIGCDHAAYGLKEKIKQTLEAVEDPSADAAEAYRLAQKRIDEAVSKGVLHKKTAARKKARLAKRVNSASS